MHYNPQQELSYEEAKAILDSKCSPANSYDNRIDYLYGRAIKVHLCPDRWNPNTLEVGIYNEYNGNSAAQRAIRGLRHKQLFKTIS